MAYEYMHQPLKGLFLFYQFCTTIFWRLPFWTITFSLRALRPRWSWSLERALRVRLSQHMIYVGSKTGLPKIPNHLALVPGVKGLWVHPDPELVLGDVKDWADAAAVETISVPGYWIDKHGHDTPTGAPVGEGEKVIYALHGGGYITLSANPGDITANIARGLVEHCTPVRRAFSLEYRLSATAPYQPAHPFPTALIDALMGYNYLVNTVGFAPEDIIVEGDSAGGNLALALTRYLVNNQRAHPRLPGPPSALLLLSPSTDLSLAHYGPRSSLARNAHSDYLLMHTLPDPASEPAYAVRALLGPHPPRSAETNPYISPASPHAHPSRGLFAGFPTTFVACGGAEQFVDPIRTLVRKMELDVGQDVVYHEAPDAVHDYLMLLWHEPERTETLRRIGEWVDDL